MQATSPSDTTKAVFSKRILRKRCSRIAAVQTVYALLCGDYDSTPIDEVIFEMLEIQTNHEDDEALKEIDEAYMIQLVRVYHSNQSRFEAEISKFLSESWSTDRLAKVVLAILFAALSEMYLNPELEKKIVVNEYIEIAKLFNHDGEAAFINSILDKVEVAGI